MIIGLGLVSFFIGAIPFGYILVRWKFGLDIREYGSKNIGATNVGRIVGWKYGSIVLFLDALKGVVPVFIARFFFDSFHDWEAVDFSILMGGIAILGHIFTPFLGFKGGKGVATALGVCLAIIPLTTLGAVLVFFLVLKLSGYVSLGSIIGSGTMPFLYFGFYQLGWNDNYSIPLQYVLIGLGILIAFFHKDNLMRIYHGKELKAVREDK